MAVARKTKFGSMREYKLPYDLMGSFELMTFENPGTPHRHAAEEIVVCVDGHGFVHIGGGNAALKVSVAPGDAVTIPAQFAHHMEPLPGQALVMMILYGA